MDYFDSALLYCVHEGWCINCGVNCDMQERLTEPFVAIEVYENEE